MRTSPTTRGSLLAATALAGGIGGGLTLAAAGSPAHHEIWLLTLLGFLSGVRGLRTD